MGFSLGGDGFFCVLCCVFLCLWCLLVGSGAVLVVSCLVVVCFFCLVVIRLLFRVLCKLRTGGRASGGTSLLAWASGMGSASGGGRLRWSFTRRLVSILSYIYPLLLLYTLSNLGIYILTYIYTPMVAAHMLILLRSTLFYSIQYLIIICQYIDMPNRMLMILKQVFSSFSLEKASRNRH